MTRTTKVCPLCNREISRSNFSKHLHSHETNPTYQAQLQNMYHTDKNTLTCQFCNQSFKSINAKAQHEVRCASNPHRRESFFNTQEFKDTHESWNKGLTKETDERIAKQAAAQKADYGDWINELNDDGKLHKRFVNKRVNAKKENIGFELTFEQYCTLVKEAGLKSSQLGYSGENYVLGRYNDIGPYAYGNCRFITQLENARERKTSDAMLNAGRKNLQHYNNAHSERYTKGTEEYNIWLGKYRNSNYYKQREAQAKNNKLNAPITKDIRYCGEHNSQTGTYWITNGTENKKWSDNKGAFPDGFYKGRTNANRKLK